MHKNWKNRMGVNWWDWCMTAVSNTVHLYGTSVLELAIDGIKCGFNEIE